MSSRLWMLMHFCLGSHALPARQGRLARPAIPQHLRRCTLCSTRALGDERVFWLLIATIAHCCCHFQPLYQYADSAMECVAQGPQGPLAVVLILANDAN